VILICVRLGECLTEPTNPFDLFRQWYDDAKAAGRELPNAMALATASAETARPSNRFVLLKGVDDCGFVFFSNYDSRKGEELEHNPHAAAVLFWPAPRRQVRIEGRVEKLTPEESDEYFQTRDRLSQIGAIASPQSRVIAQRDELDREVERLEKQMEGRDVPRPPYWGGYRIVPDTIEFWTGRENRLHDRIRFRSSGEGGWIEERLAP
jgi:pyridoxamine 5'-phosphate oxidase